MNPEYDQNLAIGYFEKISAFRQDSNYLIAENMEYLFREVGVDFTESELFNLAVKVQEAAYASTEPLLHQERLDAVRCLLEYGISEKRFGFLPTLTAEQTKDFLLTAERSVLATLIDIVGADNREYYNADNAYSISQQEYGENLVKALKQAVQQKKPLAEQIQNANSRTESPAKSPEKEPER